MADDISFVRLGKNLVGLSGLTEIFQALASRAFESPAVAQEELLCRAAGANYIPPRLPGRLWPGPLAGIPPLSGRSSGG